MMLKLVCLCFIPLIYAATTPMMTTRGSTHEPNENEQFLFKYDHTSHMMVAKVGHRCYVYKLSHHDQRAVHSSGGITTIEVNMLNKINALPTSAPTLDGHTLTAMSGQISHLCARHTKTYLLQ